MKTKHQHSLAALIPPSDPSRVGKSLVRHSMLIFMAGCGLAQADIIEFDLSPLGLTPQNEVPPVVNSTGSGNEISGGIFFDTVTSTLSFAIGYGSASGVTTTTA